MKPTEKPLELARYRSGYAEREAPPKGGPSSHSLTLAALARRVRALAPSHRDPEAFHVEKDEIERALRRIAGAIR